MKLLCFTLWMLLWPLVCSFADYLAFMRGRTYSDAVIGISAFINALIWVIVAVIIYKSD